MFNKAFKIITSIMLAVLLMAPVSGPVMADEADRLTLEEYLEEITLQLEENNNKLDEIYNSIDAVNLEIEENTASLAELEESLAEQKEDMAIRIRYMYEAGTSVNILAAIISSGSIADIINRADYISEIVGYDRDKLELYQQTIEDIEATKTGLEDKRAELIELKDSFEQAKIDGLAALADVSEQLAAYNVAEEDIPLILEEYIEEHQNIVDDIYDISEPSAEDYIPAEDTAGGLPDAENTYDEDTNSGYTDEEQDQNSGSDLTADEPDPPDEPYSEPVTTTAPETTRAPETTTTQEETTTTYYEEPTTQYVEPEPDYYVPIPTYGYSARDIYDLARITYLEDGCTYPTCSYQTIYLVACVILNRAYNWYGGSISAAIYDPGQYATAYKYTSWGGGTLYINDITWSAVNDALSNLDPNPYYQANGDWLSASGLTEYYRDPVTDEVFYYPY